jgi:hypothetical protein
MDGITTDPSAPAFDRRIGRRHALGINVVPWEDVARPLRLRTGTSAPARRRTGKAVVQNISVTGARVIMSSAVELREGDFFRIDLDGVWGVVRVVSIGSIGDETLVAYGVTFTTKDQPFLAAVAELVGGPPPPTRRYSLD